MTDHTADLKARLATPDETGLDPTYLVPLLRLLATGDPVEIADLASAAGRSVEETRAQLAKVPETEYDAVGRILGQGLTLRPTRHRFTLPGRELYTWCALDTLIFPVILNRTVHVESVSATSGQSIRLTAGPSGITDLEPSTAVVSLVNPEDMTEIRSSFCDQVHFFASADDARPWLESHPGLEILPVADAFQLGLELTTSFPFPGARPVSPRPPIAPFVRSLPRVASHQEAGPA
jgi:alkylmercury lyase